MKRYKYYAYKPDSEGREPLGSANRLMFELSTDAGAIRRAKRALGDRVVVMRHRSIYDDATAVKVYPPADGEKPELTWDELQTVMDIQDVFTHYVSLSFYSCPIDRRGLCSDAVRWGKEFWKTHTKESWDDIDYYEKVSEFAFSKLREHGYLRRVTDGK